MNNENSSLLTREQVQEWLDDHGKTHQTIADDLGVKRGTVRDVLYGDNKGRVNAGHRVAVALRLKAKPQSISETYIPEEWKPKGKRHAVRTPQKAQRKSPGKVAQSKPDCATFANCIAQPST